MHRRHLFLGSLAVLGLAPTARAADPTVVLELFTSQGCSSCPPADALLGEMAHRPTVIALAWHVDYWNNLGWRDPYAQRQWTERQRRYAFLLQDEVYTPALVVNGSAMVVGSDRSAVDATIRRQPTLPLQAALRRVGETLEASIDPPPAGATALLALYDPESATAVGAGENGGRRLHEYHIVREVRSFDIVREVRPLDGAAGRVNLGRMSAGQGAALLVQDAQGRMLGAADFGPVDGHLFRCSLTRRRPHVG